MKHRLAQTSFFIFTLVCIHAIAAADTITIHNRTTTDFYVAIYYKNKGIERRTSVQLLKKYTSLSMERPKRKTWYDRGLVFSPNSADIKKQLTKDEFKQLPSKNVGALQGSTFYIAKKDDQFKGYTTIEWNVIMPSLETAGWIIKTIKVTGGAIITYTSEAIKTAIQKTLPAIKENPFKLKTMDVRVGNELPKEEQAAINKRTQVVKNTLKNKLGLAKLNYVPKIAFIASGGGYRSMAITLGFLSGASLVGLLDCITWISSLSGSSWALGTWLATAAKEYKESAKQLSVIAFKDQLFNVIHNKGLETISVDDIKLISNAILVQATEGRPITLVTLYGILLANRLLSDFGQIKQHVYISDQAELIKNGQYPIPIYTAVRGEHGLTQEQLEWYEFTPWEIGGAWLGMYAPSFSYGRKFDKGKSQGFGPPQDLGFHFGTYGSAFAATIEEIYLEKLREKIKSDIIRTIIEKVIEQPVGRKRLSWAEVYNFTKGMQQSPIADSDTIKLIDGGHAFNLPYPPVSGERPARKPDILIFLDASATINGAPALGESEAYAYRKGLKFPTINYEGIDQRTISVFKDEQDPEVPVVIYMPRINDPALWPKLDQIEYALYKKDLKEFNVDACVKEDYCGTFNLTYSKAQAQQLSKLGEFNMRVNQKVIFDEIKALIERKS